MRRFVAIFAVVILAAVAYGKPRIPEQPIPAKPLRSGPITLLGPAAAGDTIFYGGTTWMPDSMRWEAIRDSVWTFDSGVGSSINTGQNPNKPVGYHETMEGWHGLDVTIPHHPYFRRSDTCNISGSWSMWAGVTQQEADSLCYAAGQGYGNSWRITLVKTFSYPGSGNVSLQFEYAVEAEATFDYAYVVIDTTGDPAPGYYGSPGDITLHEYTGSVSGTGGRTLVPGSLLRSTPGPVTIKFIAASDGSYSDEDGLFTSTCGHSRFDNISLSGAITDFSDFESGDDGWSQLSTVTGEGDYSNLALADSLPPPVIPGPCAIQDSVLVFFNESLGQSAKENLAVSPWIDLKRNGDFTRPGRLIQFDVHADSSPVNCPNNFVLLFARTYPFVCDANGLVQVSEFKFLGYQYFGTEPFCTAPGAPWTFDGTGLIPTDAEQIQIAIGVFTSENCVLLSPTENASTPWFDNVRFGVYGTQVGVPREPGPVAARLGAATPNPLRSSTRIDFTMPEPGRAAVTIIDAGGRYVRTLIDADLPEGSQSVDWDGRDDRGRRVSGGVYFYRMTAGAYMEAKKLVVIQ